MDAMKTIGILLAITLSAGSGVVYAADKTVQPNVLLIISDDQGWADYGFTGHPQITTPNLDKLAAQSLTFTRGYSPVPVCRPSLASIATGLYPHQHGVTGNIMSARTKPTYDRKPFDDNFAQRPNLIRDLTGRGYVSFQTGKWWEGDPIKTAGFSRAMKAHGGSGPGGAGRAIGRKGLGPIYQFIEQAGGRPWLVWYAPMLPHAPHNPPNDLLQKYLKLTPSESVAHYWGNVEWFDRTVGELLAYLDKTSQRNNTIILFTTDNGWIQDPKKGPAPRSKLSPYEGGVRTPIMIRWPGKVMPRMDTEHLASNVDLWPTLAALLQTPAPKNLPGINLTDERAVAQRQHIFGEQYTHRTDADHPTRSLRARWIIAGWWKLIVRHAANKPGGKTELYDLQNDPWEKNDLAGRESARVEQLRKQLNAWWKPEN
jgi:arylsulfatase A-like enzyme